MDSIETYNIEKNTEEINEIFDDYNKQTSIELVDLLTFKTMVDFNIMKH